LPTEWKLCRCSPSAGRQQSLFVTRNFNLKAQWREYQHCCRLSRIGQQNPDRMPSRWYSRAWTEHSYSR
jgi:hypothetical protein